MREYVVRKNRHKADYEWWDTPNTESLARTVYEQDVLYDTGMLDMNGDKIMAREKKEPIGFVRFR